MEHPLDNPIWNALISGNKNLSQGNEHVKYFSEEVAPFVGMSELTPDEFEILYHFIPFERSVVIIVSKDIEIPKQWTLIEQINALQLVHVNPTTSHTASSELIALQNKDVPQMISLTAMTHPGPFLKRTIEFGNYEGIFNNGELVSMAGQRFHANQYVEISAVCTHPDFHGKGYAGQIIQSQIRKIKASSEVPFLHVRNDNIQAIHLYKSLGFEVRKPMNIYAIQKTDSYSIN
jgi:hypothetical protein